MPVELQCSRCGYVFGLEDDTPIEAVLNQVAEEGPWSAVGDGETVEDRVFTALSACDCRCPQCGANARISEEQLAAFAHEMLAYW
jgi:hypothetical protein